MKITVLSHNLSSNAAMRAYRLASAARNFADVTMLGPADPKGTWAALPQEPWIKTVPKTFFPDFCRSLIELAQSVDGDIVIAVKPKLASFGAALLAAERRPVPVILDIDDLDLSFTPRARWSVKPWMADLSRPGAAIYGSLLTRAVGAASAITVSSAALQRRFGGTVVPHGADTALFDPAVVDRAEARDAFGFSGPTVLFPGTPRAHKGVELLARAVGMVEGVRLAITCQPKDFVGPDWDGLPLQRLPILPYSAVPRVIAAADLVAIPQLDSEPARYQMPMKLFDAMAMGAPIVASSVSDLPSVLNGCGRLVPPGEVDKLAAAIHELLNDPAQARALGAAARARCQEHYSLEQIGARLGEVVSTVARRELA
jgi:glycosyltransferase involved in cell wall biosynthesis